MALKALMLRKKIDGKKQELEQLRNKDSELQIREAELEQSIEEAQTEEEKTAVEEEIEKFETEKQEHEDKKVKLEQEVSKLEEDLEQEESTPAPQSKNKERTVKRTMENRAKFFGMGAQERDVFFAREDVKDFLQRTRDIGLAAASQKRAVTGAELTIPEVVLDLIRENIMNYSKLVNRVRLRPVPGKARQNVMGVIPEAVWTEMCASLNELDFGFSQTEVDGYKVGGVIYICKAILEDSDINLAQEIINALGVAIGIALDKAILYGNGTKMPLGIVPRLAQDSQPSDYPAAARPWEDLTSHLITIEDSVHGLEFYKKIALAAGSMKSRYSRGVKFWAMNDSTYTTLIVESMNYNSSGAIVSIQNGTMPVVGGDIVVLSDDIIANGNIVAGYGDLYLLAERAGSEFARSDEYRFAEDQISFKGTARYDGTPVIAEGFIAIGIGVAPAESATFTGDTANDATLAGLEIGSETLSPDFASGTYAYTIAAASAASAAVIANPSQANAKVTLEYEGKTYPNGGTIKWTADSTAHPLTITVKQGVSVLTYTVNVTKASA